MVNLSLVSKDLIGQLQLHSFIYEFKNNVLILIEVEFNRNLLVLIEINLSQNELVGTRLFNETGEPIRVF